jgi:DNA mismatch repair ATPase MutS
MVFETKKKIKQRLIESFGNIKNDLFYFESIEKYFRNKDHSDAFQVLSDKTCNDLDFNELFMFVDRTTSKVGQQFLYNTLRTIPSNGDKFIEQEKLIEQFTKDSKMRLKLQIFLDTLTKESTYFITSLFQDEHIKKPKWFFIIPLLSFTSLLSLLFLIFTLKFFLVLLGVFIINLVIHYWNKQNLYEYLGSIPQLLKLNGVAKELLNYNTLKNISPDLSESIKIIDKVKNLMSFFNLEVKLQSDIGIAFWSFLELIKALFLLEPLLLFGVLKQLDTKRKEIEKVFSFVGYVDSLISIASLRQGLNQYCLPEIKNKSKVLEAIEVYHPLIINCIPNSIQLAGKSILLTGSNMSGKTSFIRTIGLNAITALTINTCFARQFSLSRLKIYSAIRISDDLMNDKSYYFEEVLTIKEMIEKSQMSECNLFLLDEIFKGTNTIERISAGSAVLSYLNNESNIVFVSTHDIELADLLQDTYELYHFRELVDNKTIDFDFKLKSGKLKNRNAIRILEINDYPVQIITEAIELSKELDKIYVISKRG